MTGARTAVAALTYAETLGWPVFPCRGKVPWISKESGGNGVHDATTDLRRLREWWARWLYANVGVAAGARSRWWALDVDPDHGGADSLAQLEAKYGRLPPTVEQITGSGGRHILFAYRGEPIRNRAGVAVHSFETPR